MANYYCTARTNYFRVKDADAFNKWIEQFSGLETIVHETEGTVGVLFDDGVPNCRWETEKDTDGNENDVDVEVDFMDELAEHLADNEVAILQEAGAEKLRFINGYAIAINNKKETKQINLDDIYALAKELGSNITKAEY